VSTLSDDGLTAQQQLQAIRTKLRPLLEMQQQHYRHSLKSHLCDYGVHLTDYANLNAAQRDWLNDYFQSAIFPVLTPLAVDPSHPFPFISNLSLNVAALVRDPDTGQQEFARVKVPQKNLPRFVQIPPHLSGKQPEAVYTAVPLEQVVAFNLGLLFPGMHVEGHYFFRVTRDADLELRDLEADDLMEALEEGLRKRRRGGAAADGRHRRRGGRRLPGKRTTRSRRSDEPAGHSPAPAQGEAPQGPHHTSPGPHPEKPAGRRLYQGGGV
jgi:polyphosphate kinase